jgi:hypothetical protein
MFPKSNRETSLNGPGNGTSTIFEVSHLQPEMGDDNMDHEPLSDEIHPAPNGKFYVLWQGCAVCLLNGSLRYFKTEQNARAFLAECAEESDIDEFAR